MCKYHSTISQINYLEDIMNITVIIPTKNRAKDLVVAVKSVINQSSVPNQLVIVDQSDTTRSKSAVKELLGKKNTEIELSYIYDRSITGLVHAKQVGVSNSVGDIVCFLEDDIVLEHDFIEQILQGFTEKPEMVGCCGIVTNMPSQIFIHKIIFRLFHRGIYLDKRVGIYGAVEGRGHELIASKMLSGGLSAWSRKVFIDIPFDPTNGFFMLEDVDFSTRVAQHFGPHLYINPNARLEHNCSPVNREALAPRHRRKLFEYIKYYKNRRSWSYATISLLWLLLGVFFESLFIVISTRSVWPLKEYILGVYEGFKR